MADWARHAWVEEAGESTLAVVESGTSAEAVLTRLGPVEALGDLSFDAALDAQGGLYDDGTEQDRAIFQIARLPGAGGDWWVTVEPNGYRASLGATLVRLAGDGSAASLFWNVNAVMSLVRVVGGEVVVDFDPLVDTERVPEDGRDLPFGLEHPRAAALTLLERWTGVRVPADWFSGSKPTYLVAVPA